MKQTSYKNLKGFLLSVFVFLTTACSDKGTSPADLEHRILWESFGIKDYIIHQQRQCFCVDGGRIVQVVIRSDTLFSITALDTLPNPLQGNEYMSINSLFDFIETSRTIPSARVEVLYNERFGYPERIFVDRLPNTIDDEIAYLTSGFLLIR